MVSYISPNGETKWLAGIFDLSPYHQDYYDWAALWIWLKHTCMNLKHKTCFTYQHVWWTFTFFLNTNKELPVLISIIEKSGYCGVKFPLTLWCFIEVESRYGDHFSSPTCRKFRLKAGLNFVVWHRFLYDEGLAMINIEKTPNITQNNSVFWCTRCYDGWTNDMKALGSELTTPQNYQKYTLRYIGSLLGRKMTQLRSLLK